MNVYNSDRHGRIGIFEWNGGADNESWRLIPETSTVETVSVDYDLKGATTDLNLPPMVSAHSNVDNTHADVPMTGSITLALSETTSRASPTPQPTPQAGHTRKPLAQKAASTKSSRFPASASFNESTSKTIAYTDATVDAKTVTYTQLVNTNVPAGKKYRYSLMVFNGKCSIPYTAHMLFKSAVPGAVPTPSYRRGVYTGVNTNQQRGEGNRYHAGTGRNGPFWSRSIPSPSSLENSPVPDAPCLAFLETWVRRAQPSDPRRPTHIEHSNLPWLIGNGLPARRKGICRNFALSPVAVG